MFASLASSGGVVNTPSKSKVTPIANSSPSSGSGLRERRQQGEPNIRIVAPNRIVGALPQIGGKENEQSRAMPATSSTTSMSLKERIMVKLARK